jgi:signal transduction histidine kinase
MWRHPIRWLRSQPDTADLLLALLVASLAVSFHWIAPADQLTDDTSEPTWWGSLLVLAATLPVAWRRRAPEVTAAVVVTAQILSEIVNVSGAGWIGVLIALYSLGAHGTAPWRNRTAALCAAAIGALLVIGVAEDAIGVEVLISTTITVIGAFVLGDNAHRRREHLVGLAERAERAERERELLARERVTEERTRIARELHDVVAHSVSVMVIQAGAARRQMALDPARASEALSNIEDTGRHAMDELRRILGVLRHDDPRHARAGDGRLEPQPSLDAIETLVHADPDLHVTLHVDADLGVIPQSVGLNAYRIVQESLTNVRRHAGVTGDVDVSVRRAGDQLLVEVIDDGRGAGADPRQEDGFGLIGMRERVSTLGGELEVGPRRGGGWRVTATLPLGPT